MSAALIAASMATAATSSAIITSTTANVAVQHAQKDIPLYDVLLFSLLFGAVVALVLEWWVKRK